MNDERPDLVVVRKHLRRLVTIIVIVVVTLLALTVYLYQRFTAGVTVTP